MLTQDQIKSYQENGYLLVKGVFTREETAAWRQEGHQLIDRFSQRKSMDSTWGSARKMETDGQRTQLLHCHDVQFYSAAFSRLIVDERLMGIASQIVSPNIQLHHTKMFIKPPEKGSPFPMHQDYPFFPHENHTMTAAIIHFDDAPLEKGCVRVVSGSHKLGPIPHIQEGGWHLSFDEYPLEKSTACPAEAGDVLFFNYLTIHGSGVNTSNEARTTLLIQMRDPEDQPSIATHLSKGQGQMLWGIDPSCGTVKPKDSQDAPPKAAGGMMGAM